MQNTFRIKTDIGQDKVVNFQLDQNIEFLEILSFKIRQSEIYTLDCANYGVVAGRITANNGFGIPNARVSIFIPLSEEDEDNELITSIYPYKTISDKNEDGYRYNLLPYEPSYPGHIATGTFPTIEDVMFDGQAIEVFEKYYKYTVKTNSSGDYMIFGIPVGSYTILMDLDLSDIGEFSLTPQDLIRMGRATEAQFKGNSFQKSSDLESLPQIVSLSKGITISPLWGDPETCDSTINRVDFDLRADASIDIQPTAIFIGSIFGTSNIDSIRINCGVKESMGNLCQLETGPGQILAIRQTRNNDANGLPILEEYELDNNGRVIDGDGTWVVELPMNLEYVVTDENGNQIITNDEKIGIPRKGKYRFKVKWQDVDNSTDTSRKAHFLVPNIKEYGWDNSGNLDPINSTNADRKKELVGSYYFGLDWDGYTNKDAAIRCEDTFYEFEYNKVYTVAGLVDQYQGSEGQGRFIGIKEISDRTCEQNVNKYPVNDGVKNFDLLYFLVSLLMSIFRFVYVPLILGYHLVAFLWNFVAFILLPAILVLTGFVQAFLIYDIIKTIMSSFFNFGVTLAIVALEIALLAAVTAFQIRLIKDFRIIVKSKIKTINLPNILYPSCEFCECSDDEYDVSFNNSGSNTNGVLTQLSNSSQYFTKFRENFNWTELSSIFGIKKDEDDTYESDKDQISIAFTQAIGGRPTNSKGIKPKHIGETDIKTPKSDQIQIISLNRKNFSVYSETLPIGERINYFNLRRHYFDGVNKIKVKFAKDNNLDVNKFHYDNVIVVLSQTFVETGALLTFVSNEKSQDPNYKVQTVNNNGQISYGVPGLNRTEFNKNISVKYANTESTENIVEYILPTKDNMLETSYYPSDLEYFQVVTGLTYGEYINKISKLEIQTNTKHYLPNILSAPARLRVKYGNQTVNGSILYIDNPLQYFDNIENQYIIFLQRGVDPYSPEYINEYDFSRLFGFGAEGNVTFTASTKLNIPIQINKPGDKYSVQTLTNDSVLFRSYHFLPNESYKPYKTKLLQFYSGLLNGFSPIEDNLAKKYEPKESINIPKKAVPDKYTIGDNFFFIGGKIAPSTDTPNPYKESLIVYAKYSTNKIDFNGGTYMVGKGDIQGDINNEQRYMQYYSYSSHLEFKNNNLLVDNREFIVVRTDRLPTSDGLDGQSWYSNSVGILQQNNGFNIYVQNKQPNGINTPSFGISYSDANIESKEIDKLYGSDNIIANFNSCEKLYPFSCYSNINGKLILNDDCKNGKQKEIIKKGCYQLVKRPILDIAIDIQSFREWSFRFRLNYAICRGIISETFVNNWVNGSLYMMSFRVDQSITDFNFCKKIVFYDKATNNFYYRSSPYSGNKFIGRANSSITNSTKKLNYYNLMYPTTIINLGIKSKVDSRYDDLSSFGFILDKINTTSYYDNSDLVNLYIISRLLDDRILKNLSGVNGLLNSFFSRNGKKIDSDLAQLLSINSEFGVTKFSSDIYFSGENSSNIIFRENNKNYMGVFYNSNENDLRYKDYITPGRVNFSNNQITRFNYYGIKSQNVPFYTWTLEKTGQTIFGKDKNNWGTQQNEIKSNIKYQSLERIKPKEINVKVVGDEYIETHYFTDSIFDVNHKNNRGYIFSQLLNGEYNKKLQSNDKTSFIVGAPFHFYFGIKKGFSAMDKFKTKYLNE